MHGSVKRAKDRRLLVIRSRKLINATDSAHCGGPEKKIQPALGTNQIKGLLNSPLSRAEKKIKKVIIKIIIIALREFVSLSLSYSAWKFHRFLLPFFLLLLEDCYNMHQDVASSRRSVSQGAAKNSARENKNSAASGAQRCSFLFCRAFLFFRALFSMLRPD